MISDESDVDIAVTCASFETIARSLWLVTALKTNHNIRKLHRDIHHINIADKFDVGLSMTFVTFNFRSRSRILCLVSTIQPKRLIII